MDTCFSELASNIQMSCSDPMTSGYTGRGLIIPIGSMTVAANATNPRILTLTPISGKTFYAIDNVFVDPFTGSSKQSNGESGRVLYTKNIQVRIPARGAVTSKSIVEAIQHSAKGYILLLEKRQQTLEGGYEVIGAYMPCKATADGTTQNESENGGDVMMMLQTNETYFECDYRYGATPATPSYSETAAKFEEYYAAAGTAWPAAV